MIDVTRRAHLQSRRYPFHRHSRLCPQPHCHGHLPLVSFGSASQLSLPPPPPFHFFHHHPLGVRRALSSANSATARSTMARGFASVVLLPRSQAWSAWSLSRNSALTVRGTGYFIGGVLGIVASARLVLGQRFPALSRNYSVQPRMDTNEHEYGEPATGLLAERVLVTKW